MWLCNCIDLQDTIDVCVFCTNMNHSLHLLAQGTPKHWMHIYGISCKATSGFGRRFIMPTRTTTVCPKTASWNTPELCMFTSIARCLTLTLYSARIRAKIQEIKDEINDNFLPGQAPSQLEFLLVITVVIAAIMNPCMSLS